jgi:hypothetical protein
MASASVAGSRRNWPSTSSGAAKAIRPKGASRPAPTAAVRQPRVAATERLADQGRRRHAQSGGALNREGHQRDQHIDHRRRGVAQAPDDDEGDDQTELRQTLLHADRPTDGGDGGDSGRPWRGAQKSRAQAQGERKLNPDADQAGQRKGCAGARGAFGRHRPAAEDQQQGEQDLDRRQRQGHQKGDPRPPRTDPAGVDRDGDGVKQQRRRRGHHVGRSGGDRGPVRQHGGQHARPQGPERNGDQGAHDRGGGDRIGQHLAKPAFAAGARGPRDDGLDAGVKAEQQGQHDAIDGAGRPDTRQRRISQSAEHCQGHQVDEVLDEEERDQRRAEPEYRLQRLGVLGLSFHVDLLRRKDRHGSEVEIMKLIDD